MAWLKIKKFFARMCNNSSMFNSTCCARKKIVINITEGNIDVDQLNDIVQDFVYLVRIGDRHRALEVVADGLSELRRYN